MLGGPNFAVLGGKLCHYIETLLSSQPINDTRGLFAPKDGMLDRLAELPGHFLPVHCITLPQISHRSLTDPMRLALLGICVTSDKVNLCETSACIPN